MTGQNPRKITKQEVMNWVASKINEFLAAHPERTVTDLANDVGVTPETVNRWRRGALSDEDRLSGLP